MGENLEMTPAPRASPLRIWKEELRGLHGARGVGWEDARPAVTLRRGNHHLHQALWQRILQRIKAESREHPTGTNVRPSFPLVIPAVAAERPGCRENGQNPHLVSQTVRAAVFSWGYAQG